LSISIIKSVLYENVSQEVRLPQNYPVIGRLPPPDFPFQFNFHNFKNYLNYKKIMTEFNQIPKADSALDLSFDEKEFSNAHGDHEKMYAAIREDPLKQFEFRGAMYIGTELQHEILKKYGF
jgi:hypothetical protein